MCIRDRGYIADDLAGILLDHGVERFVINLGGNVLVRGGRPRDDAARPPVRAGAPWKIGIVNPRDPAHYRAIVDVSDGSVVTSGLHERRFTRGGRTYHHILNPMDGMPARTDVASATIIASASIDCDGYSTAALMLGMDEGPAFVEGIDLSLIHICLEHGHDGCDRAEHCRTIRVWRELDSLIENYPKGLPCAFSSIGS